MKSPDNSRLAKPGVLLLLLVSLVGFCEERCRISSSLSTYMTSPNVVINDSNLESTGTGTEQKLQNIHCTRKKNKHM
jgi:hypothetical protein